MFNRLDVKKAVEEKARNRAAGDRSGSNSNSNEEEESQPQKKNSKRRPSKKITREDTQIKESEGKRIVARERKEKVGKDTGSKTERGRKNTRHRRKTQNSDSSITEDIDHKTPIVSSRE